MSIIKDGLKKAGITVIGIIGITIFLAGWGLLWTFVLKWAWNFVMPDIFGLPEITYWKMFALYMILSSLWKVRGVKGD